MRTEDDLRTALTTLERHAPAAARVLPGSRRRTSQGLRSPRTVRWIAVSASAATLAGVVTALVLPAASTPASPNGSGASALPANDPTVRAKLLAAFSAARDDVVYEVSTAHTQGHSPMVSNLWSYPSRPRPGQLVEHRDATVSLDGVSVHEDTATTFVMPPVPSFAAGPADVKEQVWVDYLGKTWSDSKNFVLPESNPDSFAVITRDLNTGQWTVTKTTLNGRAALELFIRTVAGDNSWTTHLWVDAATYLPLHEEDVFGPPGMVDHVTTDYQYLPPTAANRAKLKAPIPPGFKQVINQEATSVPQSASPKPLPVPSARPSARK